MIMSLKLLLILSRSDGEKQFLARPLEMVVGGIISLLFSTSSSDLLTRCSNVSCSDGRFTGSVGSCFSYRYCERTLSNTFLGFSSLRSA